MRYMSIILPSHRARIKSERKHVRIDKFRHRTWNHFCWTYTSRTGVNNMYFNGDLVGSFEVGSPGRRPVIDGSRSTGVLDSAFMMGQEPDDIRGRGKYSQMPG